MPNKERTIPQFLNRHLWQILVVAVTGIIMFFLLDARVSALEEVQSEYPSQDWFKLRFDTIDQQQLDQNKRFESLEKKIEESKNV